ncbi:MAG TPA: flagellar hook-length control protein FliK, partial [Steroidobacteraceae bacterium]|nr:flagellar hook-length control protein FliK [Steroidobacteraceae bacterium]
IDMQSSQVNVSFSAPHPDTRSALEQSVPQLRAILANGGLTLGQATVQQEARPGSHYTPGASRGSSDSAQSVDSVSISPTHGLGLIDEYV